MKPSTTKSKRNSQWVCGLRQLTSMAAMLIVALILSATFVASGQGVISTNSSTGVNLDNLFNLPTNSVTITSGLNINNSLGGTNAVTGISRSWSLTVNSNTTIIGNSVAVSLATSNATVVNSGSITGNTAEGVLLQDGGNVVNLVGGSIRGIGAEGVSTGFNLPGNVFNAGTITSAGNGLNSGIILPEGGSVNNVAGGFIGSVGIGVFVFAGSGAVTNGGTIIGTNNDGVLLQAGGNVNNLSGGAILGNADGVTVQNGLGSVINAGLITGTTNNGVTMTSGGSLNNLSGGIVTGQINGASFSGGKGAVTNGGSIIGTTNDGVLLQAGGSVNNLSGGKITGRVNGIEVFGGNGSVINAGDLVSSGPGASGGFGNAAVLLSSGGTVNNLSGGTITATGNGVSISGGQGAVSNAGKIIGGALNDGVILSAGGSVNNLPGATIAGGFLGVAITGGSGFVTNAGTIIGSNTTAISLASGPFTNIVALQTGSHVQGNIVNGNGATGFAFLTGNGQFDSGFQNFQTLTVQGDSSANGWNFTGTNSFSSGIAVQSGLFRVNGDMTTPLLSVLGANGGIGGSGIIRGNVDNNGFFAPGNSIGTLTILGSMTNRGNYFVEVNAAGSSDRIVVSNTATIKGGQVIVQAASGVYGPTTVYTILTATNGVTGTYDGVVSPGLLLAASLTGDSNDIYLTLNRQKIVVPDSTPNRNAVGNALEGIANSPGSLSNLLTQILLVGTASQLQQALDSLNGQIHGTLGELDIRQQDVFNHAIGMRTGRNSDAGAGGEFAAASRPVQLASAGSELPVLPKAAPGQTTDFWLQGLGSFGHMHPDGNAFGGNYTIGGLAGGLDYRLCPQMLVGLGAGYSHNDAGLAGTGASGSVDAYQIAGYGGYVSGPWHLDGILSYGFLNTETKRQISVGSINQQANASYDGGVFSGSVEGGYTLELDGLTIEPTLGLNYSRVSQDSFAESGTASDGHNYGLNVSRLDADSFRTDFGVRMSARFGKKDGVQFIPAVRAVWEHEFLDRYANVNANFAGGSGGFVTRGLELGASTEILGASLTVAFNKAICGFVNCEASLNSRMTSSTVSGGFSYSW